MQMRNLQIFASIVALLTLGACGSSKLMTRNNLPQVPMSLGGALQQSGAAGACISSTNGSLVTCFEVISQGAEKTQLTQEFASYCAGGTSGADQEQWLPGIECPLGNRKSRCALNSISYTHNFYHYGAADSVELSRECAEDIQGIFTPLN